MSLLNSKLDDALARLDAAGANYIKNHYAVEHFDNGGPGQYFVSLKKGYNWSGQHSLGTETIKEMIRLLKSVEKDGD